MTTNPVLANSSSSAKFSSLSQFDEAGAKLLGKGGFGLVRSMKCLHDDVTYALKIVNIAFIVHKAADEEHARKLKDSIFNEAKLMRQLDHANIVKVHGSFLQGDDDSGTFCIVMEFCEGETLRKWIDRADSDFEEYQILDWSAQILSGIKYLHANKILHRDIKAENILMDKDRWLIKLGDFGISKASVNTAISARTVIGTPSHMPPEVLQGNSYNWKSDVWSFGVVLFDMCARRLPFQNYSNAIALALAISDEKKPIPAIPTKYSVELRQVIESKLLVRNVDNRATIGELCNEPPFLEHVCKWERAFDVSHLKKDIAELQSQLSHSQEMLQRQAAEIEQLRKHNLELEAKLANQTISARLPKRVVSKQPISSNLKLVEAAPEGNLRTVVGLLADGADPNSQNGLDDTALIMASRCGFVDIAAQLLANGACVDMKGRYNFTALIEAAQHNKPEMLTLLLENGANIESKGTAGSTALMLAASFGHVDIVAKLLAHGADVNSSDKNGDTALIETVKKKKFQVVPLLLAQGADVNHCNKLGESALTIAQELQNDEIVNLLKQ